MFCLQVRVCDMCAELHEATPTRAFGALGALETREVAPGERLNVNVDERCGAALVFPDLGNDLAGK